MLILVLFNACSSDKGKEEPEAYGIRETLSDAVQMETVKLTSSSQEHGMLLAPSVNGPVKELPGNIKPRLRVTNLSSVLRSGRFFGVRWKDENTIFLMNLWGIEALSREGEKFITKSATATPGDARDIVFCGDMGYAADGYAGISVIDFSVLSSPVLIEQKKTKGSIRQLTLVGEYLYACSVLEGLQIFSPSADGTLNFIRNVPGTGRAFYFIKQGDTGYLCAGGDGMLALSLASPESPEVIGRMKEVRFASAVSLHKEFLALVDKKEGLLMVSRTNERDFKAVGAYRVKHESRAVLSKNGIIYFAEANGLHVLEFDEASGRFRRLQKIEAESEFRSLDINDDELLSGDGDWGYRLFKIKENGMLKEQEKRGVLRLIADVAYKGNHIYAAAGYEGCRIINAADPENPQAAGLIRTAEPVQSICVSDDRLYVCDHRGFHIYDISEPASPVKLSAILTEGRTVGIDVRGDIAAAASWFSGALLYDVSNPEKPVKLSQYSPPSGWAIDLKFRGDMLYVCVNNYGLAALDVSDVRKPVLTHLNQEIAAPEGLGFYGEVMYAADFNLGTAIFDIDDPKHPRFVLSLDTHIAKGITIVEDMMAVSNYLYGVKFFSLSPDPFDPELTAVLDTPGKAYNSLIKDDLIWIADWHSLICCKAERIQD